MDSTRKVYIVFANSTFHQPPVGRILIFRAYQQMNLSTLPCCNRQRIRAGFTLTELLVVIAIISLLVGLMVLSARGITGGTNRRAAVGTIMGAFDQARSVAISDGRSTYVVFVSTPRGQTQTQSTAGVATEMWGRAYAVFQDPVLTDAVTTTNAATTFQPQQRSAWLYLPTGVAFKSEPGTPPSLTDSVILTDDKKTFKVPATGGAVLLALPYVKFDSTGQIVDHVNEPPQVMDPSSSSLRVLLFEGTSNSAGVETPIRRSAGTTGANIKYALDEIMLKSVTGRAKYTFDPAYNLATPTPTPAN